MIEHVIANLVTDEVSSVILLSRREFALESSIPSTLQGFRGTKFRVVNLDEYTDGPAETANLAIPFLDLEKPLVIANSDQYINADLMGFYDEVLSDKYSGVVMTMEDNDPKWSYVLLDPEGMISQVVEKRVVSKFATTGIYGFRRASTFVQAFEKLRAADERTNGEFYVGPCYNFVNSKKRPIQNFGVGPIGGVMFGLGIPGDLETFVSSDASLKSAKIVEMRFH
jgi:NDP-sugar pyrophosphorylase family protein